MGKKKKKPNRHQGVSERYVSPQNLLAQGLLDTSKNRAEKLQAAAHEQRLKMEVQSARVRDLILAQPPVQLLGYLVSHFAVGFLEGADDKKANRKRRQKSHIKEYQLALEYAHAVWCCHSPLADEATPLDKKKIAELFQALEELERSTMIYCMASSAASNKSNFEGGHSSSDTEFHAKSTWTLIRGNRYQVLEREFFQFMLEPHNDELFAAYGMTAPEIASEIQAITDSMREGYAKAAAVLYEGMEQAREISRKEDIDPRAALEQLQEKEGAFSQNLAEAIRDMFYGGVCNLSKHSKLTTPLLQDLSYSPGENTEFFAKGDFSGTPMRTLPARIKPGIKLGDCYYATDGQFVRDSAYRAIQRGLISRLPAYREDWNKRQKELVEKAYSTIFAKQLAGASIYSDVYYPDPSTGNWVETDMVIVFDDILFVVEAKAGGTALDSPATNFDRHKRAIRDLIVKAYEQCRRFVTYLNNENSAPIFAKDDSGFKERGQLRLANFRHVFPIGLTVEAFTPFSTMAKEFPEVVPILGKYPFISMSVDDLFVLNRFLPDTGSLLHYLEVRQAVAGIPRSLLFDEIDHLGAYILKGRFDVIIRDQLKKADMVTWDSFSDVVDEYFERDAWRTQPAPTQLFPGPLKALLDRLDYFRPTGWLVVDSWLRNLGSDGRTSFSRLVHELTLTLPECRQFAVDTEGEILIVWICGVRSEPSPEELEFFGQAYCLATKSQKVNTVRISFNPAREIISIDCATHFEPSIAQINYSELLIEAKRQSAQASKRK